VIFNHNWWPGINEGDLLRVTLGNSDSGFLFFVPREDYNSVKPQLQVRVPFSSLATELFPVMTFLSFLKISIPGNIAEVFGIRNNGEITVTKVRNGNSETPVYNSAPKIPFPARERFLQSGLCRVCIPGPIPRPKRNVEAWAKPRRKMRVRRSGHLIHQRHSRQSDSNLRWRS
jgi:hypothetical protein